jgi:hypothetical protein
MVTYILLALGAAAVALLAGLTGGLPSPSSRPRPLTIEDKGIAPEPELESEAVCAGKLVNRRPWRTPHIITGMACAVAMLVGALGAVAFRLTACDQLKLEGTEEGHTDGTATVRLRLLRSAQAMPPPSDIALFDRANVQVATPPVVLAAISEPSLLHEAHEMRVVRRSAVRTRDRGPPAGVSAYATHLNRGTWLFPPDANGGG